MEIIKSQMGGGREELVVFSREWETQRRKKDRSANRGRGPIGKKLGRAKQTKNSPAKTSVKFILTVELTDCLSQGSAANNGGGRPLIFLHGPGGDARPAKRSRKKKKKKERKQMSHFSQTEIQGKGGEGSTSNRCFTAIIAPRQNARATGFVLGAAQRGKNGQQ